MFELEYRSSPTPCASWTWDGQQFYLSDCNANAAALSDGLLAEGTGRSLSELYGHIPGIVGRFERCLMDRRTIEEELSLPLGRQRVQRWVRLTLVFVPPNRVSVYLLDLTERQAAETALRESEARLRALIEGLTELVIILDVDARYLQIAPTNHGLLYRPEEELLGRTVREMLPADEADLICSSIRRVIATRRTVDIEYSLPVGGATVWFSARISPLDGDRVVFIARDITEEYGARAAAVERARLEGALLAARTAQHELRNQLTLTVGATDLIYSDDHLPANLQELAMQALAGAEAAVAALDRLQRITRLAEVDVGGPGPMLDIDRSSAP